MKHAKTTFPKLPATLALFALAACGGPKVGQLGSSGQRPELLQIEIGRLVDVYAYQRIDASIADRRLRINRRLELVARNVVVNANLESQSLFDAAGNAVATAHYEFLPFNKTVGHEELVILHDNRLEVAQGTEASEFNSTLKAVQLGMTSLPPSYRGQNTLTRPIPIVPRNAALKLTFSSPLEKPEVFFSANPEAIQVLEFKGDPAVVAQPENLFRVLPYRVVSQGSTIILDTTILAGEARGVATSAGLPSSADSVTPNIRIAIPARGSVSSEFYVKEDPVKELNGLDSSGRSSVIRDFRSGNLADGAAGRLREPEAPMIVAPLAMGITSIDAGAGIVTLNKRSQFVPVRGRYPFVDGPLSNLARIPLGPLAAPIQRPLATGDFLTQTVQAQMPDGTFETVNLRAEILENLEVGTMVNDPAQPVVGLAANAPVGDSGQGEKLPVVRVRVASVLAGRDSRGRPVAFQSNSLPLGQDCVVRALYYESIPFASGGAPLSDASSRNLFVRIDPKPSQAAVGVQPNSSVAVEFTKPMDLDQVDNSANFLVTNTPIAVESFLQQMGDAKKAKRRVVPTRLADLAGDGTILRLQPPLGFFHVANAPGERYSVHVRLGAAGVTDLAGNSLQIADNPSNPQVSWSVDFELLSSAASNLVGWTSMLFEDEDEDGTLSGSTDLFGQFRLENGRLTAASGQRFSRSADASNLGGISRILRGECWDATVTPNVQLFPVAPTDTNGAPHPGLLYWQPRMSDTISPPNVPQVYEYWQSVPQPVGRVVEPLKPQGSRMQMRYIEDDFSLSYRQPSEFCLDVERLYWSPFIDESVLYDTFDRFTMSLAHAKRRPDEFWFVNTVPMVHRCSLACQSMNSSLSLTFSDNAVDGTSLTPVFEDAVYKINPGEAFRSPDLIKYVPFPRFDRSYTWRDSRLVTVDANGAVIGLGGALQPAAAAPNDDMTANIDSPWVPDGVGGVSAAYATFIATPGASTWVMDPADFVGTNALDHDPIALPLLVDFKVFSDDSANGISNGSNGFQVAMLGCPSNFAAPAPGGYYDLRTAGCGGQRPAWPRVRVQASGGIDLITGNNILIDVANQLTAQPSVVKDAGLGNPTAALFLAPAGDGMLNWARADFVRKVSTMTFGFFDTLRPQLAALEGVTNPDPGFPNLSGVDSTLRIRDVVTQLDPPQARQPAGTSVFLEMRGAEDFDNATIYNPSVNDVFDTRGNLLNANYACEAYRYSQPNVAGAARIAADRLTRYVTEDQLALIRDAATGLLPRYMNLRLVMTNNVTVTPALSPSLRSMSIVYRMLPGQ